MSTQTPNRKAFSFLNLSDAMAIVDSRDRGSNPPANFSEGKGYGMAVGGSGENSKGSMPFLVCSRHRLMHGCWCVCPSSDFNTQWLDTDTRDGLLFNLVDMSMYVHRQVLEKTAHICLPWFCTQTFSIVFWFVLCRGKTKPIIGASSPADMLREMDIRGAPKNFDVMKLDLDSFECDILERLLVRT